MGLSIAIAGAGLSGAVVGRALAEAGHTVTIFDTRPHVAGNCHTERDAETNILVHRYGPHIFHTDNQQVWDYVNRFATFRRYEHRVRSTVGGQVFALPVNLHTINQFFGTTFNPAQAQAHIASLTQGDAEAATTFEDRALALVGRPLYEAFFQGYTEKQWGCAASKLPAAIFSRLPVRTSYDDRYFSSRYQAIPAEGYTHMTQGILDHPGITIRLDRMLCPDRVDDWDHVFWSGALDGFFDHAYGRLGYRSLRFEEIRQNGDGQGCAVMNYGGREVDFTRITEHKHFAPWEHHDKTIMFREFATECGPDDIPYYPIRLAAEKAMLSIYVEHAEKTSDVTFIGRLGTYRYVDMDKVIAEAMQVSDAFLSAVKHATKPPVFSVRPL